MPAGKFQPVDFTLTGTNTQVDTWIPVGLNDPQAQTPALCEYKQLYARTILFPKPATGLTHFGVINLGAT